MKWYVLLIDSSRLYFSLSDENISPYEPSVSLFPPLRSFSYDCGFGVPKEKYICFTEVLSLVLFVTSTSLDNT